MNRTSLSGLLVPALMAVLPGCEDTFRCPGSFMECSAGTCVDIMTSADHCGACGYTCDVDDHCEAGFCVPNLVCNAPEENCGNLCVNTQTSNQHCGACDEPCPSTYDDCVAGDCISPILVLHTSADTKGPPLGREAYVLRDLVYTLTQITDSAFTSPRVIDVRVLPDGRILLVAAQTEDVYELFIVSPRGGALTRVSAAMPAVGDVQPGIAVSRDGTKVLYRADADTDDVLELYAVSLAAPGTAVKVNGPLVAGGRVSRVFELSANGRRATYVADADTQGQNELYTVDLTAATPGSPRKLNAATTDPVWDFEMTPDGARVVYRTQVAPSNEIELRVVSVATPGTRELVGYTIAGTGSRHVDGYHLSPDGTRLAFTASLQYLEESLWSVDLTQAPPYDATLLSNGTASGGNYFWVTNDLAFTADSARVVFRQVDAAFSFERLYTVALANPSVRTQLSAAGTTTDEQVGDFVLSPDGARALFRGGADGAEGGDVRPRTDDRGFFEQFGTTLYRVDVAAATPAPALISAPIEVGENGISDGYLFLRDSNRAVYRADHNTSGQIDAFLVTPGTPDPRPVSPPLDASSDENDVLAVRRF